MFLWTGRKVRWRDKLVRIVLHISKTYVLVSLASNENMRFMVRREELKKV